ncbi:MAG: hypothetical protein A3G30_05130 [Chlamydiae bacterium RIFCSPLOWO2_12_FULL_49_12]|nr:MAG: hypothetical protein A3G30_05130 [Chlamydiae bacterium RIFCSPLOWO2_12_FULL_49_12]
MNIRALPVIVGFSLFGFMTAGSLSFLFGIMVGAKAINYALMGPALKQLYIPTTPDVRFKALAWIETFGSRSSKQAGSVLNMTLAPLQRACGAAAGKAHYLLLTGCLGFPLIALWFVIALFLGRTFKRAVAEQRAVC